MLILNLEFWLGLLGSVTGVIALIISVMGNKLSKEANDISKDSRNIAKEANEMSKEQLNLRALTYCTYDPRSLGAGISQPEKDDNNFIVKATSYTVMLKVNPNIISGQSQAIFFVGKSTNGEHSLITNVYNDVRVYVDNEKLVDWFFVFYFLNGTVQYCDVIFVQVIVGERKVNATPKDMKYDNLEYDIEFKAPKDIVINKVTNNELFGSQTYLKVTKEIDGAPSVNELEEEYQEYAKIIKDKYKMWN